MLNMFNAQEARNSIPYLIPVRNWETLNSVSTSYTSAFCTTNISNQTFIFHLRQSLFPRQSIFGFFHYSPATKYTKQALWWCSCSWNTLFYLKRIPDQVPLLVGNLAVNENSFVYVHPRWNKSISASVHTSNIVSVTS